MKAIKLSDLPLNIQKQILEKDKQEKNDTIKTLNDLSFLQQLEDEPKKKNREITNHKDCWADGIHFKSNTERDCYLWFKGEGIMLHYEKETLKVNKDFEVPDNVKIWFGRKKRKSNERIMNRRKKFQDIEYTPDFKYESGNDVFYIEIKGHQNETYPMRKKLFIKNLCLLSQTTDIRYHFFEAHDKTEIYLTCELIKSAIKNGRKENNIQGNI